MRTKEQIDQEYANVCAALGDAYYRQMYAIPEQIESLKQKIDQLKAEPYQPAGASISPPTAKRRGRPSKNTQATPIV